MRPYPLLTLRGLSAGYERPVNAPVWLEVSSGEVVGLSGPNGAGKSTLLRVLTGQARIFAGSVHTAAGATVALLDQRPARMDSCPLTGRDLLRACEAGAAAPPRAIEPLLGQRLDTLSGGALQLLHVWACLGGNAALVLLDEPTNHLDPEAQVELVRVLRAARGSRGRALVVISHDRAFLDSVCDRVAEVRPALSPQTPTRPAP